MALEIGSRLGHYEVTAKIGEGGMGQVFRATDTKLNRQVALKILPEAFASDPDRLARFQREAQVLASLNHPGIAAIHGIEESEGQQALVLELVEGPTLADRIAKGPIPLDEALPIAKQIAEALEAAHEAGVVHRDLKPANIKVRDDGTVKVLDFGLAKALDPTPEGDPSQSPTVTAAATQMGVIMGTAAYMSPEQARGKPVDKRADIWAFGVVLYEMLTGRRPFQGDDISVTLASVIKSDVDVQTLPVDVPSGARTVMRRCLQKDPAQRIHDIADVRLALGGAFDADDHVSAAGAQEVELPWWQHPVFVAGLALSLGVFGTLLVAGPTGTSTQQQLQRFVLTTPPEAPLSTGLRSTVAISTDGTRVAYRSGPDRLTGGVLYVRTLDALDPARVVGADDVHMPFFSPDGEWVAFADYGGRALARVQMSGGLPREIVGFDGELVGATWGPDDTIVFATTTSGGLQRVPAVGGLVEQLTTPSVPSEQHVHPTMLPDAQTVLFTIRNGDANSIAAVSLETGVVTPIVDYGLWPRYVAPGHVVYGADGTLMAVAFDASTRTVTSEPVPILDDVGMNDSYVGVGQFDLSKTGALVYATGVPRGAGRLVWVDRMGNVSPLFASGEGFREGRRYAHPRLSPDDTKLAVTEVVGGTRDLWVYDLVRGSSTRLTTDIAAIRPLWSLDGARVFFGSEEQGAFGIYSRAANGSGEGDTVLESDVIVIPHSFTPDGTLSFLECSADCDIWALSPEGVRSPYLVRPVLDGNHRLSPDGRWIAYNSNEAGNFEVYLQSYPTPGERVTVSDAGGTDPVWSADGTELFYLDRGSQLMVASVETAPSLRVSRPQLAQEHPFERASDTGTNYDVASDGERFVAILPNRTAASATDRLILVQNWLEELTRLVPLE